MPGAIVIAGYGPGISHSVALLYGKEKGHPLILLARTQSKLDSAVHDFETLGVKAVGIAVDLADTEAVLARLESARQSVGPVEILFWNSGGYPKALLDMAPQDLRANLAIHLDSLLAATQLLLPDLERHRGALLVTGGGLGDASDSAAQLALDWGAASLALAKAGQRKLVHLLHLALRPRGVFAGEVTVCAAVRGTPWDDGSASLTADAVAQAFARLHAQRGEAFARLP